MLFINGYIYTLEKIVNIGKHSIDVILGMGRNSGLDGD